MDEVPSSTVIRKIAVTVLATGLLSLIAGCDPGMTLRQTASNGAALNSVILLVKPTHQLIGETWYAPQITLTNSSQAAVTITGVELSTKERAYSDSSPEPQAFPRVVPPGHSQNLTVLFRLDNDIQRTFRQSAELRVRYRSGEVEDMVTTAIARGPLDDSH